MRLVQIRNKAVTRMDTFWDVLALYYMCWRWPHEKEQQIRRAYTYRFAVATATSNVNLYESSYSFQKEASFSENCHRNAVHFFIGTVPSLIGLVYLLIFCCNCRSEKRQWPIGCWRISRIERTLEGRQCFWRALSRH